MGKLCEVLMQKHIQDVKSSLHHEFSMLFRQEILLNGKFITRAKYVFIL
jgi:hypothetical protein